jgi:ketosteroid isomerase-like protein
MPAFVTDPPPIVFLLLAAALIVTGLVWLNRRSRKALIAFLAVILVTGIVVLLDRLLESPREEAVRRVQAMVAAADRRDPDAFMAHVADSVVYQGESQAVTYSRDQLRRHHFWITLQQFNVHVAAWDFARDDVIQPDDNTIEIGFLAKGETGGKQIPAYFRATFKRQPDGQWKLNRLASFDPIQRTKPLAVPGLASAP